MLSAAVLAGMSSITLADNFTWNGNGGDPNLKTAGNWTNNVAPSNTDSLFFDGGNNTSPNNDFTNGSFSGITFTANASGFNLGGNAFTLNGDINDGTYGSGQNIQNNIVLSADRNVTVFGDGTINLGTVTLSGIISDGGAHHGLIKNDRGILVLTNANTYTGATTISGGSTILDFSAGGAPTNNIISASSTLNFSGQYGSLMVNGNGSTVNNQTFAATNIASQTFASIGASNNGTVNLSLGNLSVGTFGTVNFFGPTTGTISVGGLPALNNGILGGSMTYGSDWAVSSGGHVVPYSNYVELNVSATLNNDPTSNVRIDGTAAGTPTATAGVTTTIYSLLNTNAGNSTLTIPSTGTLQVGTGIYKTDNTQSTFTIGGSGTTCFLTGGVVANTPATLYLTANMNAPENNGIVINAVVTDNGTGPLTIVKAGYSTVQYNVANTYTGGSIIDAGKLRTQVTGGFGTGSVLVQNGGEAYVNGGTQSNAFFLQGFGWYEGANGSTFTSGAMRLAGNNSAVTGTVTLLGDTRITARGAAAAGAFITGQITGAHTLELGNGGTTGAVLTLGNSTNNWTGGLLISPGTVKIGGTGEVIPNGAGFGNVTLNTDPSGGNNNAVLELNGQTETINGLVSTFHPGAGGTLEVQDSTGTGTIIIGDNNATADYAGQLRDNGGQLNVVKIGGGIQTFDGDNNYGGVTNINNGTLRNNGNYSNSGTWTVASGGTLGGHGQIQTNVIVNSGGGVAPGNGDVGSLQVNTISLNSSNLSFNLGAAGASELVVNNSDGLSVAGVSTITLANLGGLNTGTYTILDYNVNSNSPLADLSNFHLATTSLPGFTFSLVNDQSNTSLDLSVTTGPTSVNAQWGVGSDGSWSVGTNWQGGVAPHSAGDTANFGTLIQSVRTVTLDVPETVGTIIFNSAGSYTITGGSTLTLDTTTGNAGISVVTGSHTIATPVAMNKSTGIDVANGNTLTISGNLTGGSAIALTKTNAGTLALKNLNTATLSVNAGKVQISQKGSNTAQGGTNVIVKSLAITSGAQLDLTNNSMVIDYSTVGTLVNDTRQELLSGQLKTSLADLHHGLGYGDNATLAKASFNGTSVDTTSILVKYTYLGDTNLDGKVDVTDLGALSSHWQQSGVWTGGDFNYDGTVNVTDLGILASNWQQGVTTPLLGANSFQQALEAVGLGNVQVPEPTMLGLLGLATMTLMNHRRRK